jgi:hypothetical protein
VTLYFTLLAFHSSLIAFQLGIPLSHNQKQNAMKASLHFKAIIFSGATFFSSFVFGQNSETKVWVSFENINAVPQLNDKGSLVSSNQAMNQLILNHNIKNVNRPLSNSRNEELNQVVELTCSCDQNSLINDLLSAEKLVKKIEKAPVYQTLDLPNDYSSAFANDYALNLINANAAWDLTHGDPLIRIGVSDQNFYAEHEELAGKFNYYDPTNTATKTHGTSVAITAAGNTNNATGKSSIGYNTSLGLYRMNFNDVLAASYAGCKVVNLSWSSGCSFNSYLQSVVNEVYANGTFIVASAGNGTTCGGAANLVYPAAYQNVFAVSSIGQNNNHERIMGNPNTTHQHNASVDLCAPGYDVPLSSAPGFYTTGNGSSFAAPFVSGTVALMMAVNPCLTNQDIEYILKQTAFKIDSLNPNYAGLLGAGRLDAAEAVEMAKNYKKLTLNSTITQSCTQNSAAIALQITGGNAPLSILWNNGQTDTLINNLTEGTYSVVVTDSNNCRTDSLTVSITYPELTFVPVITHESSINAYDASIDITLNNNINANFSWSNGQNTEDIYGLTAGLYTLNIQTLSGCSVQKTFLIETLNSTNNNNGSSTTTNSANDDNNNNTVVNILENNKHDDFSISQSNSFNNSADVNNMQDLQMIVYPNPTSQNANVKWTGDAKEINVLNTNGQIILNQQIINLNNITLNSLAAGVYHIQLIDFHNNSQTQKLIVQ